MNGMNVIVAKDLDRARLNFSQDRPLAPSADGTPHPFYVARNPNPVAELEGALTAPTYRPAKFFVSGVRGGGKSTELLHLAANSVVRSKFLPIVFRIGEEADIRKLDATALLHAIARRILLEIRKLNGATKTSLAANASAIDVLATIELLAAEMQKRTKRAPLIIIDDLDDMSHEDAHRLFVDSREQLLQPSCTIVYTVPMALFLDPAFDILRDQAIFVGSISESKAGRPNNLDNQSYETLTRLAAARMHGTLATADAVHLAGRLSGGIFGEMVRLMRYSISCARRRGSRLMEIHDVEDASAQLRGEFRAVLDKDDMNILRLAWQKKTLTPDARIERLARLCALIASAGSGSQYAVHPALRNGFASGTGPAETLSPIENRVDTLLDEVEVAARWQRPAVIIAIYSSEFIRKEVRQDLANHLADTGLSARNLNTGESDLESQMHADAAEIYEIGCLSRIAEAEAGSRLQSLQRFADDNALRIIFWLTQGEARNLARIAPEFWAHRDLALDFTDSPTAMHLSAYADRMSWQSGVDGQSTAVMQTPAQQTTPRGALLHTLALLNIGKGDYGTAESQLNEALAIARSSGDEKLEALVLNALGRVKCSTGRPEEGLAEYTQAQVLAPRHGFILDNIGTELARLGRAEEAAAAFQQALVLNANDAFAHHGLASLHLGQNRVNDAFHAFGEATKAAPHISDPWCGLAEAQERKGDLAGAENSLRAALAINNEDGLAWGKLAALLVKQGKTGEASEAYEHAVKLAPNAATLWHSLGGLHLQAGSRHRAIEALEQAVRSDKRNADAHFDLATAYSNAGRDRDAVSQLLRSIDLFGSNADKVKAWSQLGAVYRNLQDYPNAVAAYSMADQLAGTAEAVQGTETNQTVQAAMGRVTAMLNAGSPIGTDTANSADSETLRRAGDGPAWMARGVALQKRKEYAEAVVAFQNAVQIDPHNAIAFSNLGLCHLELKQGREAVQGFERCAELMRAPADKAAAWTGVAAGYRLLNDYRNAMAAYQKAGEVDPNHSPLCEGSEYAVSGATLSELTAFGNKLLPGSVAADPFTLAAHSGEFTAMDPAERGRMLMQNKRYRDAISALEQGLPTLSSDAARIETFTMMGKAYRMLHDHSRAAKCYERAAILGRKKTGWLPRAQINLPGSLLPNQ